MVVAVAGRGRSPIAEAVSMVAVVSVAVAPVAATVAMVVVAAIVRLVVWARLSWEPLW